MFCQIMFCNKSIREIVYFLAMFQKYKWVEFRKDCGIKKEMANLVFGLIANINHEGG